MNLPTWVWVVVGLGVAVYIAAALFDRYVTGSASSAGAWVQPSGDYVKQEMVVSVIEKWDAPQIRNLNGVPWHEAVVPPRSHRCWPQTEGWVGFNQTQRCACGAIRMNGRRPLWLERNSR